MVRRVATSIRWICWRARVSAWSVRSSRPVKSFTNWSRSRGRSSRGDAARLRTAGVSRGKDPTGQAVTFSKRPHGQRRSLLHHVRGSPYGRGAIRLWRVKSAFWGVFRETPGSGVGWLMKRGCPSVRLCSGKTGLDRERTPSWHMESFSVCCCKETWFRQSPRHKRFKSGTRRGCGRWSQD